jgi:hypothetical protein
MKNLEFTGNLHSERLTIKQISKPKAKKLYESGETIYIQSSNFHPIGVWSAAMPINVKDGDIRPNWAENDAKFENRVNSFEYYNCSNEQGRYSHFYQKIS